MSVSAQPYGSRALAYYQAGFSPIPLPARAKSPVPEGWTGHAGKWPAQGDVAELILTQPTSNVGLRLPENVIGIDVDAYDGKQGAETLAAKVAEWGELPATWRSSARGNDNPSGIRYFRVPEGLRWPGAVGAGVEIVRFAHRYAVAPPSIHPNGNVYEWVDRLGDGIGPNVVDLPELPEAWVQGLTGGLAAGDVVLSDHTGEEWAAALAGPLSERMAAEVDARLNGVGGVFADGAYEDGSARHDWALAAIMSIISLAGHGHSGGQEALNQVREHFGRLAAGEGRAITAEFARMVDGAKARATITALKPATTPEAPVVARRYELTELGLAKRLIDAHGPELRHLVSRNQWLSWQGYRWVPCDATVYRNVIDISKRLPAGDKAEDAHRKRAQTSRSVKAVVELARTHTDITVEPDELDAQPYELNTPGGIVNLRTGDVSAPDPLRLHTRSTTVAPDFDLPTPGWLTFLADTFAGEPDVEGYIQRLLGVSLCGEVLEQVFAFMYGPTGANGKSTLAEIVQQVVGKGDHGYSLVAPAELLLARQRSEHPAEIARLAGARIVFSSELEDGQAFAEAKVKMLTGKDTLAGRFMQKDWFTFTPTHSLFLTANNRPSVRVGGSAFWRRIRLIAFENQVPEDRRQADLAERLVDEEGPGILAWLINGARDYFAGGIRTPGVVLASTEEYRVETDTVGRFVDEMCETGSPNAQDMHVQVTRFRTAYEAWCAELGEEPVSAKTLTVKLRAFGVQSSRAGAARFYDGIQLIKADDDATKAAAEVPDGAWADLGGGRWR